MGNYSTRLGCTLSFNEESEKDVVRLVEQLQGSRKIGEFIGYLLRIASENPELLDKRADGSFDSGSAIKEMARLGVTPTRYQYIQAMAKEVDSMKQKIDEIYDMSLKMYTMAQFGKQLGLSDRSDNMLMASFLAEQELTKMCKTFGVNSIQSVFASSKLEAAHNRADDTLKYIIETYDSIINELKNMVFKEVEIKTKPLELKVEPVKLDVNVDSYTGSVKPNNATDTDNRADTVALVDKPKYENPITEVVREKVKEIEEDDDEEIEFGTDESVNFDNADLDLLANFFGDQE